MKRGTFLQLPLLGISIGALDLNKRRDKKGYIVRKGQDRLGKPLVLHEGDLFHCKISTSDTDGELYSMETTKFNEGGPALHVHKNQDEFFLVLEGQFAFKVGDQKFIGNAGDLVFGPRGIPHTFSKVGKGRARMLVSFTPALRMEEYFNASADGRVSKMTAEEKHAYQIECGFETVGPAIGHDKKVIP